jgi:hypothetical protein
MRGRWGGSGCRPARMRGWRGAAGRPFLASRASSSSMAAWSAGDAVLVEQVALAGGGQHLALLAEADALVVGQFEGEGLDFEFGGVQGRVAQREGLVAEGDGLPGRVQFGEQPVEFLRGQNRPARQGGKGVRRKGSKRQVHAAIIPR